MDVMEAIRTRRSIREYKGDPIPEGLVKDILAAGMSAPSAGNEQPWHFIVITDKALLGKVPEIHQYANMAPQAPLAVLVCGDLNAEIHAGFWVQDCSAAVQNILLAACGLGLGAVWCGIHPVKKRVGAFRKLFDLPEHIIPLAIIPMGYPSGQSPVADRFDEGRVHRDRW